MTVVENLIWDDWNKKHIAKHKIKIKEIEEVCQGKYKTRISYRKRLLIIGKTNNDRRIAIVLSPEDRNLKKYKNGTYYVVTAFERKTSI